jgi:hypothetical protein
MAIRCVRKKMGKALISPDISALLCPEGWMAIFFVVCEGM